MRSGNIGCGETRLETIISFILIIGVVISLVLELAGIVLYYLASGSLSISIQDRSLFIQGQNFFAFLYGIINQSKIQNYPIFLMTAGIAILILTPYLMIITSFFYFLIKRHFRYVLISAILVVVITISLALH